MPPVYDVAAGQRLSDPFRAADERKALSQAFAGEELTQEMQRAELDAYPAQQAAAQEEAQREAEEHAKKQSEWEFGVVADASAAGLEEKEQSGDDEKAFDVMVAHLEKRLPPEVFARLRPEMGDRWEQDEVESYVANAAEYRLRNRPGKETGALVNMYHPETEERTAVRSGSQEAAALAGRGFLSGNPPSDGKVSIPKVPSKEEKEILDEILDEMADELNPGNYGMSDGDKNRMRRWIGERAKEIQNDAAQAGEQVGFFEAATSAVQEAITHIKPPDDPSFWSNDDNTFAPEEGKQEASYDPDAPEVGQIRTDDQGDKYVYNGGDPSLDSSFDKI